MEIEKGFCQCGCGQKTAIAARNENRRGHVKGEPIPFIPGHNRKGERQQYCKNGHERIPENLYKDGSCRLCAKDKRASRQQTTIYALLDPGTLRFRYVGQTSKNINLRLNWHRKQKCPTKSLMRDDKSFVVTILETVSRENAADAERFWIRHLRSKGFDLMNISDGGPGASGRQWTDSQREKYTNTRTNGKEKSCQI